MGEKRKFVVRIEYTATVEAENEADAVRLTAHQISDSGLWSKDHRHISVEVRSEIRSPKVIPLEEQKNAQEVQGDFPDPPGEPAPEAEQSI